MADIGPFRGLRYNVDKIANLAEVVIPPYDVISPTEQELFYRINPYNMVRLELGKSVPEDTADDNRHTRSAGYLQEWQQQKILITDDQPAIYYYEVDYSFDPPTRLTRRGFLCALRLEDLGCGRVFPHERTFETVKDERLQLMLACNANLSPIFALYSDPELVVDHTLREGRETKAVADFKDRQGMNHRIWRVQNIDLLKQVRALMEDKSLFIADGHHRYETALNYRSIQRKRFPNASPRAPFEYMMVYLSNLKQSGLTVLPTHRLLRSWNEATTGVFLAKAENYFSISSFEDNEAGNSKWRAELEAAGEKQELALGFYSKKVGFFYLFKAKPEAVSSYLIGQDIPEVLRELDVVVLDRLLLRHLLGFPEAFLTSGQNIHFTHDIPDAVAEIRSGRSEAGFFINSTRVEQVQEVATAGLVMPHKSTYFYPKVGCGLVARAMAPDEEALW
ncbi:MAG: DUF1015 domain-containing protein [Syntrophobacteraceae bacterium]